MRRRPRACLGSRLAYELDRRCVVDLSARRFSDAALNRHRHLSVCRIGSCLSRYIEHNLIARSVQVELMVGVLGSFSAANLFFIFVWFYEPFKLALSLYPAVFGIGVLVGWLGLSQLRVQQFSVA